MDASPPVSHDMSHYFGILRRHWWVFAVLSLLGLGIAAGATSQMPKTYESATSVLVTPAGQDTNVSGGRTKGEVNLDTEAQLVRSTAVATGAAELLRSPLPPDELAKSLKVEVPANTSVLVITYSATEPGAAQAGSHAFAEAYLRNRERTASASTEAAIKALSDKTKQLSTTLTDVNNQLAKVDRDSPQRPNLESQRQTTQNQLNSLNGKLNELTTTTVSVGSIISDARLPSMPSSPNTMLNLATGGMVGLLLGLLIAVLWERLDRRVRSASDVAKAGVPVLATLNGRSAPRFDDVLQPYGPGGRTFNRLRNEVLASLDRDDQIVVVTGASRGSATTLVAANLATALARTGNEVVLIGAHLPESMVEIAPIARIFGIAAKPGLSEVLAGRAPLSDAVQQAPRVPSLRVVTTGGTAAAGGLMQSQALSDMLATLRRQAAFVVIEAPSTSSSADAQSLASLADAAILAVEMRRARRPEVADAAEQLRRVGTPLLGAVVLPRIEPKAAEELPPPRPTLAPAQPKKPAPRTYGTGTGKTATKEKPEPKIPAWLGESDADTRVIDISAVAAAGRDEPAAGKRPDRDGSGR